MNKLICKIESFNEDLTLADLQSDSELREHALSLGLRSINTLRLKLEEDRNRPEPPVGSLGALIASWSKHGYPDPSAKPKSELQLLREENARLKQMIDSKSPMTK